MELVYVTIAVMSRSCVRQPSQIQETTSHRTPCSLTLKSILLWRSLSLGEREVRLIQMSFLCLSMTVTRSRHFQLFCFKHSKKLLWPRLRVAQMYGYKQKYIKGSLITWPHFKAAVDSLLWPFTSLTLRFDYVCHKEHILSWAAGLKSNQGNSCYPLK